MVFLVVMGRYESWTIKKIEHQRIDAFKVMLEKTFESPLDWREINQSIIKKINPKYSLERLILKLQYFGHLMRRANSLEKSLMLRKTEARRRGRRQRMRLLENITDSVDTSLNKLREILKDREAWHATVNRVPKSQTWLSNWTTIKNKKPVRIFCMTQGVQVFCYSLVGSGGVGGGSWEEGSRGRAHMYIDGWFMLMYGRNQHNTVKQLFSK